MFISSKTVVGFISGKLSIYETINQYTDTVHFVFVSLKPLRERNMAPFTLEFGMLSGWTPCNYGILFGLVS